MLTARTIDPCSPQLEELEHCDNELNPRLSVENREHHFNPCAVASTDGRVTLCLDHLSIVGRGVDRPQFGMLVRGAKGDTIMVCTDLERMRVRKDKFRLSGKGNPSLFLNGRGEGKIALRREVGIRKV